MAAEGMQSHDQSRGNCPTASHPATKKGRINAPILPKPARCAKSDRLLASPPSFSRPQSDRGLNWLRKNREEPGLTNPLHKGRLTHPEGAFAPSFSHASRENRL